MKIYSVVNREDAKQYIGKVCLFTDSYASLENCSYPNVDVGPLEDVKDNELPFLNRLSDIYYRYVMPINTDVQIEIEEGLKCYDKHDVFGVLYAMLLRISGDLL